MHTIHPVLHEGVIQGFSPFQTGIVVTCQTRKFIKYNDNQPLSTPPSLYCSCRMPLTYLRAFSTGYVLTGLDPFQSRRVFLKGRFDQGDLLRLD